jgi:hypothetical protein
MPIVMPEAVQWAYTVTVTNATEEVFDDIVIFFKTKGQTGVTYIHSGTVMPATTVPMALGPCGAMESYVLAAFIGDTIVAQLPDQGNMTPQMASQMNPTDKFICEDSWRVGP